MSVKIEAFFSWGILSVSPLIDYITVYVGTRLLIINFWSALTNSIWESSKIKVEFSLESVFFGYTICLPCKNAT